MITSVFLNESELHLVCHCRVNFSIIIRYTLWFKKGATSLLLISLPNLTDFQNSFAHGLSSKFAPCGSRGCKCVSKYVINLWSAETRIGPLHLKAGCRRRWLNLALVLCLFCVVVHFFWLVNVCFCCARFCFSITSQEIGLGNVSEMTYFVSSET